MDPAGRLLGNPYHYRDGRTAAGVERVHAAVPQDRLYAMTGTQFMPINTVYQLAAALGTAELEAAAALLMIPDLIGYWLAGGIHVEATNASTTGLFDPIAGSWALDLVRELGLPAAILPGLVHAGDALGSMRPEVIADTGLSRDAVLTAVGSHDTASAVVGVPAADERFAYISCGTWSLVGVELGAPILGAASQKANFTNELGVDGRTRYLRNVMGLWLLQESMRVWEREGGRDGARRICSRRPPSCLPAAASSTSTSPGSCRPATCPPGSPPIAGHLTNQSHPHGRRSCAASSTAWRRRSLARSPTPAGFRGSTSTSSTSSAAAAATSCCASSRRTPAACP